MPKLDNERSIKLTKREMMLIRDTLEEIVNDYAVDPSSPNKKKIDEQIKLYKSIIFKISKKLCFTSVETIKFED